MGTIFPHSQPLVKATSKRPRHPLHPLTLPSAENRLRHGPRAGTFVRSVSRPRWLLLVCRGTGPTPLPSGGGLRLDPLLSKPDPLAAFYPRAVVLGIDWRTRQPLPRRGALDRSGRAHLQRRQHDVDSPRRSLVRGDLLQHGSLRLLSQGRSQRRMRRASLRRLVARVRAWAPPPLAARSPAAEPFS